MDLSKDLVVVSLPTRKESYTSFNDSSNVIESFMNYKKLATKINGASAIGSNVPETTPISSNLANSLRTYAGEVDRTGRLVNGSSLFDIGSHIIEDDFGKVTYDINENPFNMLVFRNQFYDNDKTKSYKTLGLVERGNQYVVFEVGVKNKQIESIKKPIVAFNKLDSNDIIFKNLNGVNKITQRVNSYDEHGVKTIMNHDYYSIIKNLYIASNKIDENDVSGYMTSVEALKTYATMNVRNISSRTTENMVTANQVLDMTGIGNKANYNDLTAELQFSHKMINPYLDQVELEFDFKYRSDDPDNKLMKRDILNSIDNLFAKRKNTPSQILQNDDIVKKQIAEEYLNDFLHPIIDDEGNRSSEIKLEEGKKVTIKKSLKEFLDNYINKASDQYVVIDEATENEIRTINPDKVKYSITTKGGEISNLRVRLNDSEYVDFGLSGQFRKAQINSQMVKEKALYQVNKTRYYFQTDDMFQTADGISAINKFANEKIGSLYGDAVTTSDGILGTMNKISTHYNGVETDLKNSKARIVELNENITNIKSKITSDKAAISNAKTKEERSKISFRISKNEEALNELELEKTKNIQKMKNIYTTYFGGSEELPSLDEMTTNATIRKNEIFEHMANIVEDEYRIKILQAEGFQNIEEYQKYKDKIMTDYNRFVNDPNVSEIEKKLEVVKHETRSTRIKFVDTALDKFDKEHFMNFFSSGNKVNKYVDVSLQSNNTKGIISQLLLSTMDLLGSRNAYGQRHGQSASKMSSAVLKTASGETLDVATASATWSPVDKYNQFKVLNKNAETVLEGYRQLTGDNNIPSLFKNISTSIYTETDFSFQDSELTSTLMGMRNLSMYDEKSLLVSYDALNKDMLFDGMDFNEVGAYFRKSGKFDIDNINNADSFEYKFLKNLLSEEAFNTLTNNVQNNMVEDFNDIGSGLNHITSLDTVDQQKEYIEQTEIALKKYNNFLNKYFVKSNDRGKGVTLLNSNAVGKGQSVSISGSNYGFIEGLEFTEEGVKIKTKGLTVQSLGSKIMNDNIKGTVGNQAHLFGINFDEHFYRGDVIVNEKMTKGKRGFAGTFYGRSLLTMSMHALTGEAIGEKQGVPIDYGKRFNDFLKIMKENTTMDFGSGKKMDIFELLGVDINFDSATNSLSIGETALEGENKKKFLSLMGSFGDLESAQQFLSEITNKKINELVNHAVNDSEAEMISNTVLNTLYNAYDKYLNTLSPESKKAARIFIPSQGAKLMKSFVTNGENGLEYGMETVQNIGKQGAFVLLSFTHGMSEAKAREIDEAVKLTRLSNIVLTESGYSWLSEELNNAMVYKNTDDVMDELMVNNNLSSIKPGTNVYNNFFSNVVDFKADRYEEVDSNVSLRHFLQKSTLGRFIDYDVEAGRMKGPLKGRFENFDKKLIEQAQETIEGIKGKKILNSAISYSADLMSSDSQLLRQIIDNLTKGLSEEEIGEIKGGSKQVKVDFLKKKASEILQDKTFMNDFDMLLRDDDQYDFDSAFEFMQKRLAKTLLGEGADDYLNKLTADNPGYYKKIKNLFNFVKTVSIGVGNDIANSNYMRLGYEFKEEEIYRIKRALEENGLGLLNELVNDFSKGDVFNLTLLKNVAENNTLPFLVKDISMDKIGDIVPNKSLDRVNKIINYQKRLSNLSYIEKLQLADELPKDLTDIAEEELSDIMMKKRNIAMQYGDANYWKKLYPHLDIKAKKELLKIISNNKNLSREQQRSIKELTQSEAKQLKDILTSGSGNKYKNKALSLLFGIEPNQISGFENKTVITQLDRVINGELGENKKPYTFTVSQISNIIKNIQNTQNTIQGVTDMQANYKILESLKVKLIEFEESRIQNRIISSIDDDNVTDIHNFLVTNVFGKTKAERETITKKIFKAMFGFKQEGTPFDDFASMRIDKSAAISPREGSAITNFIRNEAQEIIDLTSGGAHKKEVAEKTKEFRKAIGLLYGDFHWKDVEKMLASGDAGGIKTKFDRLSGVVVGSKEQWEKVNFLNFFKWQDRYNYYTYIDLLRNPHQYIGSIKPVRAVMLDETNRNLSFLKYMFGEQSKIEGGQNNLLFLGKRTAISANGDFDGDVFQIMRYTERDFKHLDRNARRSLMQRLNTSRELYYLLNDHANEDLKAIFNDPNFVKKHKRDQFGQMYNLIRRLSEHEDFSLADFSPTKAYEIIRDRHHLLKFEYLRTLDAMEDENAQHADLPTLGKKISAEVEKITGGKVKGDFDIDRTAFEKIILGLDEKDKRKLFFSTVGDEDIGVIEKFFHEDSLTDEVKKKFEAFKKLDRKTRHAIFYDYFNDLLNSNKGILRFNGLYLADTSYEAYTGISRTGIIHSSLTAVREAATFVRQKKEYENWIKYAMAEASKNGVEIEDIDKFAKRLRVMTRFANTFGSFNTLGTMIEKLSISSKLGGKVDPYISASNISKFGQVLAGSNGLEKYIDFKGIEKFVMNLRENMTDDVFVYDDGTVKRNINTIKDITDIFLKPLADNNKPSYMDEKIYKSIQRKGKEIELAMQNVFGAMLGVDVKDANFMNVEIDDKSARNILANVANVGSIIVKGFLESEIKSKDVVNGMYNVISKGTNMAASLDHFLNEDAARGINQRSVIGLKFIDSIKNWILRKTSNVKDPEDVDARSKYKGKYINSIKEKDYVQHKASTLRKAPVVDSVIDNIDDINRKETMQNITDVLNQIKELKAEIGKENKTIVDTIDDLISDAKTEAGDFAQHTNAENHVDDAEETLNEIKSQKSKVKNTASKTMKQQTLFSHDDISVDNASDNVEEAITGKKKPRAKKVKNAGLFDQADETVKPKVTLKQLRETAKEMGLKGYSKLRKAELIDLIEKNKHVEASQNAEEEIINKFEQIIKPTDPNNQYATVEEPILKRIDPNEQPAKVYKRRGRPPKKETIEINEVQASATHENVKNTSDAEIDELNQKTSSESKANKAKKTFENMSQETKNTSDDIIDELRTDKKNLQDEIDGLRQEIEGLKKDLEKKAKQLHRRANKKYTTDEKNEIVQRELTKLKEKLNGKLEERLKKIEELEQKVIDSAEQINQGNQTIERLNKELKDAQVEVSNLANKLKHAELNSDMAGNKNIIKNVENTAQEVKKVFGKYKNQALIAGGIAVLALFFRIFQSNRSVVELNINEEQYEKSQGSLYRSLGNYNINTNIRSFY